MTTPNITSVLKESRVFPVPEAFAERAHVDAGEHKRLTEWASIAGAMSRKCSG